jgi:ABC-type polysaccharide/polyol phosphate transport system, ATPase component
MIRLIDVMKFYRIRRHRRLVLDNASMTFEAGHSYGLLGVNGAGKSTTIRLLAGTELPNRGRIQRTVRVSWPLGFAGGLHSGMTGVENITFVARVYGEDERLMLDTVADFAEIGAYLSAPVQTYSSGMLARLAFGMSMAVSFECFLIDEVMGVGDARFQAKCQAEFTKRKAFADVIMASHDMGALKAYCDRGVLLADGKLRYFDTIDEAIENYKEVNR